MVQECQELGLSIPIVANEEGIVSSLTSSQHEVRQQGRDFFKALSIVTVSDEHSFATPRMEHRKYASFASSTFGVSSNDNSRGAEINGDISHELVTKCTEPSPISMGLLLHGTTSLALYYN